MRYRVLLALSVLGGLLAAGRAGAETSPLRVVQQFIEAHLQGRFAEARALTLERANLSASLFSSWLFGPGGAGVGAATADVFLSRKFTEAFRYTIAGSLPTGENQEVVTVVRKSPNLLHLYTWALAPKRGATPYELIDAIDTYLTKVNYPLEESRMEFTLVREAGDWYISAVRDEKFLQLQQQLPLQPLAAAVPAPGTAASPAASPPPTSTSPNPGRQLADAQFYATLQSFNQAHQAPAAPPPPQARARDDGEEKPSLLTRVAKLFGLGGKESASVKLASAQLQKTFRNIRDALARYSSASEGLFPDRSEIYDWQSLRRLVNRYGKQPLPASEAEAGFRFLSYTTDLSRGDYVLQVELLQPQDGVQRLEITPYGIDRGR
ncbi:MAG: hypothetical protein KatS3mg131_1839 [Candidatus Tectimicrobiota bacterium]|nr:MAG: hypothetical protein KatS3mg131_1839 [Candidatus Tectomicrobia bacterium]